MNLFDYIVSSFKDITFIDIIDMLVVSFFVYVLIRFLKETRAAQFIKGIIVVIILWQAAGVLNLYATHHIINSLLEFGFFAVLILFQPELRSMLERVGRSGFKSLSFIKSTESGLSKDAKSIEMITAVVSAVSNLSLSKTGALIVIERETKLGEVIKTGAITDAKVSAPLLRNLFFPNSALHDGAVIIRDSRIYAAGCILPLSEKQMDSDLGTRHHAAVGITEVSDALAVVVSEETGIVSVAANGEIARRITPEKLSSLLRESLLVTTDNSENKGLVKNIAGKLKKKRSVGETKSDTTKKETGEDIEQ